MTFDEYENGGFALYQDFARAVARLLRAAIAQEARRTLVADWATDDRAIVRDFAAAFVKSAENSLAWKRRRADQQVGMREIDWDDDPA